MRKTDFKLKAISESFGKIDFTNSNLEFYKSVFLRNYINKQFIEKEINLLEKKLSKFSTNGKKGKYEDSKVIELFEKTKNLKNGIFIDNLTKVVSKLFYFGGISTNGLYWEIKQKELHRKLLTLLTKEQILTFLEDLEKSNIVQKKEEHFYSLNEKLFGANLIENGTTTQFQKFFSDFVFPSLLIGSFNVKDKILQTEFEEILKKGKNKRTLALSNLLIKHTGDFVKEKTILRQANTLYEIIKGEKNENLKDTRGKKKDISEYLEENKEFEKFDELEESEITNFEFLIKTLFGTLLDGRYAFEYTKTGVLGEIGDKIRLLENERKVKYKEYKDSDEYGTKDGKSKIEKKQKEIFESIRELRIGYITLTEEFFLLIPFFVIFLKVGLFEVKHGNILCVREELKEIIKDKWTRYTLRKFIGEFIETLLEIKKENFNQIFVSSSGELFFKRGKSAEEPEIVFINDLGIPHNIMLDDFIEKKKKEGFEFEEITSETTGTEFMIVYHKNDKLNSMQKKTLIENYEGQKVENKKEVKEDKNDLIKKMRENLQQEKTKEIIKEDKKEISKDEIKETKTTNLESEIKEISLETDGVKENKFFFLNRRKEFLRTDFEEAKTASKDLGKLIYSYEFNGEKLNLILDKKDIGTLENGELNSKLEFTFNNNYLFSDINKYFYAKLIIDDKEEKEQLEKLTDFFLKKNTLAFLIQMNGDEEVILDVLGGEQLGIKDKKFFHLLKNESYSNFVHAQSVKKKKKNGDGTVFYKIFFGGVVRDGVQAKALLELVSTQLSGIDI